MFKNLTKKRLTVLLVSLSLILVAGIGVTLAYVFASTGNVTNTFTPSKVACAVVETIDGVPKAPVFGDEAEGMTSTSTKTDVKIQNTGDTEAYIRVAIVATWKKADGSNTVYAKAPVPGVDYSITYSDSLATDWHHSGVDGYYYHYAPVAANGGLTAQLIKSCAPIAGTNPEGYVLSVEIVASAIQSTPATVVADMWSNDRVQIGVDENRYLTFTNK